MAGLAAGRRLGVGASRTRDREGLVRLLDSCLLTDAEFAAGREAWKRLPTRFGAFLGPVA